MSAIAVAADTSTPLPCRDGLPAEEDLWFSDDKREQQLAARLCEGCPLKQYHLCREDGWDHEFGVWGGLTPTMRKRMNRRRFDEAVAASQAASLDRDDQVGKVRERAARRRLEAAARSVSTELAFDESNGPDAWVAELEREIRAQAQWIDDAPQATV